MYVKVKGNDLNSDLSKSKMYLRKKTTVSLIPVIHGTKQSLDSLTKPNLDQAQKSHSEYGRQNFFFLSYLIINVHPFIAACSKYKIWQYYEIQEYSVLLWYLCGTYLNCKDSAPTVALRREAPHVLFSFNFVLSRQ